MFGLGRNSRLVPRLANLLAQAQSQYEASGQTTCLYQRFGYRTLTSWSRTRRVVGKAEYGPHGPNPRFVVTSLSKKEVEAQQLYKRQYCARGEMENRIKEQQLDLFGDRTSSHSFRGNYVRLWWSMAAHLLIVKLRNYALAGTDYSNAQASTIRTRLFKVGALVETSVRRIHIRLSSAFPLQELFFEIHRRLRAPPGALFS